MPVWTVVYIYIFLRSGQVITTAAPDKNYELQKLKKKKVDMYILHFLLFVSVM